MHACVHMASQIQSLGIDPVAFFAGESARILQCSVLDSDCCVLVSTACFTELFVVILYTLKALM